MNAYLLPVCWQKPFQEALVLFIQPLSAIHLLLSAFWSPVPFSLNSKFSQALTKELM